MAVAMVFSTPMPVMASESSDDVIETTVVDKVETSAEPEKASTEADSEKSKDNTQVESNESQAESESVEEEEALEEELVVEEDEEEELLEADEEVTDPEVIVTYKDVTKKFEKYYEAREYIETLEESDSVCEILIMKDIDVHSTMSEQIIPKKNIPLLIKGNEGVKKINIFQPVYLESDTKFENITFVPEDENQAYGINLNGHNLTISKGGDYSGEV